MESPLSLWRAARAVYPIVRRALLSGQVFDPRCELVEPDPDILAQHDVAVPTPEGWTLRASVFRSRRAAEAGERRPVVMCAHPYDNHLLPALGRTPFGGPPQQYRLVPQEGRPRFSTLTSWEAPDPGFWVPAGYDVVNLNLPGYGGSEGPPTVFSDLQAKSYYDAIEWVAAQPWCSGSVGLAGVSYLAITQFHVAACRHYGGPPPSLKCIAPWEGVTDMYRDQACPGGVADEGFGPFWWVTEVLPALTAGKEEFLRVNEGAPEQMVRLHPFYDAFWRERTPDLERIELPMLVCASFSDHGLHTVGSFRAFTKAKSAHKWVYTHRGGKWDVFYSRDALQVQKEFMDCFLKGERDSGILERPPVRLEVRSSRDVVREVRGENEWPLARTRFTRLYLAEGRLAPDAPTGEGRVEHAARGGRSEFVFRFESATELTGPMKLRLWVEAVATGRGPAPDDAVLFVAVDKFDLAGRPVRFRGSVGNDDDMVTRGFCRASRRELDPDASTEWQPVPLGTSSLPLREGEPVAVDIELYPSSTWFEAGEGIRLIVAADEIIPSPPYRKVVDGNRGTHRLWFGGRFDSYLLAPFVP